MIGLAHAVALARQGVSVTVVDRSRPPRWDGGDWRLRVSSINRASEALLDAVGAWGQLPGWRAGVVRAIEVRDAAGGGRVRFDAADMGEPHLAHIVENELIEAALADVASAAGVALRAPAELDDWRCDAGGLAATLTDGERIRARLLVGADGAGSSVRGKAGIDVDRSSYGQCGLVCVVTLAEPVREVARQRFLEGGPLAFLPLSDGRCSIVWSQPEADARARLELSDAAFLEALREAAAGWPSEPVAVGERALFPLGRLHARRYIGERVALIGDAAHVIHPLAGQGANLGFADARALAELVVDSRRAGRDPGRQLLLRRYERRRRGDNAIMQLTMDAFHRVFTRSDPAAVRLRSLGFEATDRVAPLKRLFMSRAMG